MGIAELEMFLAFGALLATGAFTLVGLRMFLSYRARRLGGGADADAVRRLADEVAQLRDDLRANRDEMGELQERLDFAERLLARQREPNRLDPGR
jgi:glutathione S-transferase